MSGGRGGSADGGRRRSSGGASSRPAQSRPAQPRIAPARIVAVEVLEAVRADEAYANLLLPTRIRRAGLDRADAAFATELTYGTLRMQGFYDRVIELAANRPASAIDPAVLDVLRLGAHQLLATRVATHAAVNEQVELARRVAPKAAGFANAVLRTISRTSPEEWRELVAEGASSEDARLGAVTSHPEWIVRALRTALDHEGRADEIEQLLDADNASPRVNLAVLPGLDVDTADIEGLEPDPFSPIGAVAADPIAAAERSGGRIRVQDEGSQLAALALTRARPVESGEHWLDLCAGPGGKTAVLAAEALAGGAVLAANETVPARAELVRNAIVGVPLDVEVHVGDGRELDLEALGAPGGFDRILLDAPCTGLGALRRRPEARWRKAPADVAELTKLQGQLFDSAFAALAPGGILAYVTCSPHTAETHGTLAAALRRAGDAAEQLDTRSVIDGVSRHPLDLAGAPETVQLWPHRHGTDAMFIALVRKRA
ncbi:RsmB/NOP family class I SAM-dependent RNA methyltransferase [Agromyces cerinus]|uniref:16S rRNA (Cytosine967-C5)-methyltransferase n=1 Tax=Agromyces cerinus subsp. cerinus TaxID=232089 RepID=A0A1N6DTQ3_9MICO|nr:transcription antitermination factor NusB [Agromyces cerinus]SIN74172.1 16S rRNA (cytosine967-C5)-methyltransferase [Agromyces cerinus subsp. cerinus]